MKNNNNWCKTEFNEINFKDKRLNKRFISLANQLSAKSVASINEACGSWKDTKAAYRLFDNEKIKISEIQKSHFKNVQKRLQDYDVALALQDTTYLNYSHHPQKSGMGPIGAIRDEQKGLLMHSTMMLTETGLPLGFASQKFLIRPPEKNSKSKYRPIEEKESYRWLQALEETVNLVPQKTMVVSICDREGDMYAFFEKAEQLSTKVLVRASHDRALNDNNQYLRGYLATQEVKGIQTISVSPQKNRKKREAKLEIRIASITFKAPFPNKTSKPITLYAISTTEVDPPEGESPLNWILLTNIKIENFEEACVMLKWYCLRWQIEIFHKIFKSGCSVEKCRLKNSERLLRYLSLFSVIAWRILWMTHIKRIEPNLKCTEILTTQEWQPLYCIIKKTKILPVDIPKVSDVVLWIAMLGGFMARKNDGDPGPTVIWRGWQRLTDIVYGWHFLEENNTYG